MLHNGSIANYKRGRSFASNGPVVLLTVDGKEPGDEIRFLAGTAHKVRVRATLHTLVPVDQFDIVVNGKPAIHRDAAGKQQVSIDEELPLHHSSWIAARAIGPWSRMVLNDIQAFAHTSPVYIRFGDERIAAKEDAHFWDRVDREADCASEPARPFRHTRAEARSRAIIRAG